MTSCGVTGHEDGALSFVESLFNKVVASLSQRPRSEAIERARQRLQEGLARTPSVADKEPALPDPDVMQEASDIVDAYIDAHE
jgi:hypothetical protein